MIVSYVVYEIIGTFSKLTWHTYLDLKDLFAQCFLMWALNLGSSKEILQMVHSFLRLGSYVLYAKFVMIVLQLVSAFRTPTFVPSVSES